MNSELNRTIEIAKKIREGCPCDRVRTKENLIECLRKEIDELDIALKNNDLDNFKEELGDIFFNIIFMLRITKENNEFDMVDILKKVNNKITFRHPHVFANPKEITVEEAEENWIMMKKLEREKNIIH